MFNPIRKDETVRVRCGATVNIRKNRFISYTGGERIGIEYSTLDQIEQKIREWREEYEQGENYSNLGFEKFHCGCYHDCDCDPIHYLVGDRKAIQIEINFYKMRDEEEKLKQIEGERKQYEALRKKFEKGVDN